MSNHNVFWKQILKILKFFCKETNEIQGSTIQPLKTGNCPQISECYLSVCQKKYCESFVFRKRYDWTLFFKVSRIECPHCQWNAKVTFLWLQALTIQDLLSGLSSSLTEIELTAVCKECCKTLRTLDALGSLRMYYNSLLAQTSFPWRPWGKESLYLPPAECKEKKASVSREVLPLKIM